MEENASRVLLFMQRLCMITTMAVNHPFSSKYNLLCVCVCESVCVGEEEDCNSHDLDTRWYRAKVVRPIYSMCRTLELAL